VTDNCLRKCFGHDGQSIASPARVESWCSWFA
jgi:hypothetical protein